MFLWIRGLRLVQCRTVCCPTWFGSFCLVGLLAIPILCWWSCAESFLSLTSRLPAEVLVVEGWIGSAGIRAAAAEFEERGYQYVVVTGGLPEEGWLERRWSYAEMAGRELIRSGVAKEKIIVAPVEDIQRQRTYESAVAVWKALQARNAQPKALNVFTLGPHARRSLTVFTKVYWPTTNVGVVSWVPSGYWAVPWWRSSTRAKELLTETAAYLYEELLNSGRGSNSPNQGASVAGFACVCWKLAEVIGTHGGELRLGAKVLGLRSTPGEATLETPCYEAIHA